MDEQVQSAEGRARNLLERLGVEDAQALTTGDLVELANMIAERDKAAIIITDLLKAIEALMPGIRHLALQDYRIINEAPLRAKEWLHKTKP